MTTTSAPSRTRAEMFFDPTCPWAWMTSRWLMEAAEVRDLDVIWSTMSLSVLNEGRDLEPGYTAMLERAWLPVRTIVAATKDLAEDEANELRKTMYDAYGQRIHLDGRGTGDLAAVTEEVLAELDLDPSLAQVGSTNAVDEELRASHQRAMDLVGDEVGTPVVSVEGVAFFGPVVTPAPRGEAAGKLWDGCLLVAATPGFYEIKRTRNQGPDLG